ncbi:NUDIX hydrolase [Candidatus Gracilibacteria bacterium]|nr:NUDIX hydrolase [Candidatus Gracilibacteria bacterium]
MKTQIIHPGKWLNMVGVEHPNNPGKLWEGVFRAGTGQVVGAVVENISHETFVLVEQFRPLVDARVIELVAGLVDPEMTPEEAILKEIREETGYTGGQAHFLLTGPKSAGLTNEMTLDYYVQVSGNPGEQELETSERGLIVLECHNSLVDLKRLLASEEKSGKLISPGVWAGFGKAMIDGYLKN